MADPILELTGVERVYGKGKPNEVSVLRGVDLTVAPGELVALIAPSGAGKSTLLHISGLLDKADAGSVSILGKPVKVGDDRARTRLRCDSIGFVYQFHHLLPEFTALENVVLPQLANGVGRSAATTRGRDLLSRVGLSERFNHRPAQLSGGEQQRAAFCRALANGPKLLLADEPTGNLDPETSETVFAQILALSRETGLAALVATHNPDLAARMDRTVRLNAGRIEAV